MPWKLVEFIWRRKHAGNLWGGAITKALKEVFFEQCNPIEKKEERMPVSAYTMACMEGKK